MKLSIVIPCRNSGKTIIDQLNALSEQRCNQAWEIIVVDNGSNDNTISIVENWKNKLPNLRIIDASEKKGAAYARNTGAESALGEYIAFLDSDDIVDKDWLAEMEKQLNLQPFIASRFITLQTDVVKRMKLLPHPQSNSLQPYKYPCYLSHSGGCGLVIKKKLHLKIGGFNESMRYLEDTDYCWRAQLLGIPLTFNNNAIVFIRQRQTRREIYWQAFCWGKYNVFIYKKYIQYGMPKIQLKDGLFSWIKLVKHIKNIFIRNKRHIWFYRFSQKFGRVVGSIRFRTIAF